MNRQPQSNQTARLSTGRLLLFSLIFIGLTAAGLYLVYASFADRTLSFDWRLLEPLALLSALGLLLVYFVSDGLRLHFTLKALGYSISLQALSKLVFINLFFSNVTPLATGGGFAQIWYLQKQGVPLGRATAATTLRTLLAVFFIFGLAPFFLLFLPALQGENLISNLGQTLAFFIFLYLGFFTLLLLRSHWLIPPLDGLLWLLQNFTLITPQRKRIWQFKLRREMLRFAFSFQTYLKGSPLWIGLSIFFTALFLLSLFSFPALLLYFLDYEVDYLTSLGLLVVTTFIMYFAPTPGASGISEGVFGSFFSGLVSGGHLLLVILAWRFLTIYLGMLIGLGVLQKDLIQRWKPAP
ncbi:lysylphosphatidylglycerol synthase transmembrane domain-containing protein [Marinospirillum sp.]|uniref:lysylphosphatidylglycerol synthase transmembrane domain-containing protein n=1 Tax=Marinospirillum sp. TaxID=2183934 RepID=UPI00286FFED0|nr:lysylphosphatidylglycerol synthase transmembrane domain-containing protein [Marinospirillum sp.]MDR9467094.1 lysylphosphatidylglycerol synthase transmembrane domain-containing protein [Marinospirillum sp.]